MLLLQLCSGLFAPLICIIKKNLPYSLSVILDNGRDVRLSARKNTEGSSYRHRVQTDEDETIIGTCLRYRATVENTAFSTEKGVYAALRQ